MNTGVIPEEVRQLAAQMGLDADDPLVRVLSPQAQLTKKLDLWTETNLELLKSLNARTQETERLTQNCKQLSNTYKVLDSRLQGLELQIQALQQTLGSNQNTPNLNENVIQELNTSLKTLAHPIQRVSSLDLERRDWIWTGKLTLNAMTFAGLLVLTLATGMLHHRSAYEARLLNSALIRLERLERNLGTQPQ
ncbi:MAG: hypothetical protein AAGE59_37915 [Cyanobacteria bacterium P01_F01_bin.86]